MTNFVVNRVEIKIIKYYIERPDSIKENKMEKKKFEEYLKGRYEDQISWYENRASKNKKCYTIFQWGVIVLSASLPVLIASAPDSWQTITIVISILLVIGTAALKTFKFQENWLNYRTISETLKKEKHYYNAELEEYTKTSDKEALFVDNVESIISRENNLWTMTHRRKDGEKEKGKE